MSQHFVNTSPLLLLFDIRTHFYSPFLHFIVYFNTFYPPFVVSRMLLFDFKVLKLMNGQKKQFHSYWFSTHLDMKIWIYCPSCQPVAYTGFLPPPLPPGQIPEYDPDVSLVLSPSCFYILTWIVEVSCFYFIHIYTGKQFIKYFWKYYYLSKESLFRHVCMFSFYPNFL